MDSYEPSSDQSATPTFRPSPAEQTRASRRTPAASTSTAGDAQATTDPAKRLRREVRAGLAVLSVLLGVLVAVVVMKRAGHLPARPWDTRGLPPEALAGLAAHQPPAPLPPAAANAQAVAPTRRRGSRGGVTRTAGVAQLPPGAAASSDPAAPFDPPTDAASNFDPSSAADDHAVVDLQGGVTGDIPSQELFGNQPLPPTADPYDTAQPTDAASAWQETHSPTTPIDVEAEMPDDSAAITSPPPSEENPWAEPAPLPATAAQPLDRTRDDVPTSEDPAMVTGESAVNTPDSADPFQQAPVRRSAYQQQPAAADQSYPAQADYETDPAADDATEYSAETQPPAHFERPAEDGQYPVETAADDHPSAVRYPEHLPADSAHDGYGPRQTAAAQPRHDTAEPRADYPPRDTSTAVESPAPIENTGAYIVQPRDTYWRISQRVYGSGRYFKALYEVNKPRYPRADQLRAGDEVLTPPAEELARLYPDLLPRQASAAPAAQSPPRRAYQRASSRDSVQRQPTADGAGRIYVVQDGDTLFDIARYELGKATRWTEIYELNRQALGDNVDVLRAGTELRLPGGEGEQPLTVQQPRQQPSPRRR